MGAERIGDEGLLTNSGIGFLWCPQDQKYNLGGLFASVGQMGMGFGLSPNSPNSADRFKILPSSFFCKNALPEPGLLVGS